MSPLGRLVWMGLALWLLALAPALAQEKPHEKPWTGKLADGRVITKADLDQILQEHSFWLEGDLKKGKKADLSEALLVYVNLSGAHLSIANLSGAFLAGTNLIRAHLDFANLSWAYLREANLSGSNLINANLSGANIEEANLSGADLGGANLSGAVLRKAKLSGAWFEPQPETLPGASNLLYIQGLASLRFEGESSYGLMELRKIFKEAGMRDQERQVTYALNHNRRINA